jgi:hypothetical protein
VTGVVENCIMRNSVICILDLIFVSRKMRWMEHVVRIRNACNVLF